MTHRLGYSITAALLIFTACDTPVRMESRYEAYFLIQHDSLGLIQRDSIISLSVKENSVVMNRLMQKAGKDTIRIEGYLLRTSYSVVRDGESVERTGLHFQLLDNRGQETASVRFLDDDSTEQLDIEHGTLTIVLSGDVGKMPHFVAARLGGVDSVALGTIAALKQRVRKETFNMGTGKKVEDE